MSLIFKYVKRYKGLMFLNLIAVISFVLVELGIPTITGAMIDQGILNNDPDALSRYGVYLFVFAIIGGLGSVLLNYTSSRFATYMTRDVRNDVFKKTQMLSHAQYNELGVTSMITRIVNDAYQLTLFTQMLLRMGWITPIMIVSSFVLIIKSSPQLAIINVLSIPFVILIVGVIAKKSNPLSKLQQKLLDVLNRITRENITGVRVIRAFRNDSKETDRFAKENDAYASVSKRLFRLMSMTEPLFFFLLHMVVLIIFYLASVMISANTLNVGTLVAFLEYQFHALFSLMLFSTVFIMYPRAQVSASRLQEILDSVDDIVSPKHGKTTLDGPLSLEFNNVTFGYPDSEKDVLTNISLKAEVGQTVAFIGSTGSGKSSLINLMVRFYDLKEGKILLNGTDITEYDVNALRSHFGFISQKTNLFSGTIADNIRYGKKDATLDQVKESAELASALTFIESKEGGFNAMVSEGGSNLSGGQKQRLSIARALVRKPDIYVFDDSFSALDYKTDAAIRKNIKPVTQNSIVFVVAQRISSILEADHIIVLNEGSIEGQGTHKELMKSCGVYQEIARSQFSEKEMEIYG